MKFEMRECKVCGKLFEPQIHNQICCSYDCKLENKKRVTKVWLDKTRALKAAGEPVPKRKKKENNKVNLKKFPKHLFYDSNIDMERDRRVVTSQKEAARINREARALGLSYGQYVSKLEFEKNKHNSIEHKLKAKRNDAK